MSETHDTTKVTVEFLIVDVLHPKFNKADGKELVAKPLELSKDTTIMNERWVNACSHLPSLDKVDIAAEVPHVNGGEIIE